MLDEEEWEWLEEHLRGDFDHAADRDLATRSCWPRHSTTPSAGARRSPRGLGRGRGPSAEKLRRGADLDHWAAFGESFDRLTDLLGARRRRRLGTPPAAITVLSGDVHHAYLAELAYPRSAGVRSSIWQAVCSPFRNALDGRERQTIELGDSRVPASAFRTMARLAGAPRGRVRWRLVEGPFYDNQVATLTLDGRSAEMKLERTMGDPETDERELHTSFERSLS